MEYEVKGKFIDTTKMFHDFNTVVYADNAIEALKKAKRSAIQRGITDDQVVWFTKLSKWN